MSVLATELSDDRIAPTAPRKRIQAILVSVLCYGGMLLALLASSHLLR